MAIECRNRWITRCPTAFTDWCCNAGTPVLRSDPRSSSLITISSRLMSLAKYRIWSHQRTDTQLICRITWCRTIIFTQRTLIVPWSFMVFIAKPSVTHLKTLLPCSISLVSTAVHLPEQWNPRLTRKRKENRKKKDKEKMKRRKTESKMIPKEYEESFCLSTRWWKILWTLPNIAKQSLNAAKKKTKKKESHSDRE